MLNLEGKLDYIVYHQPPKWDAAGTPFLIGKFIPKNEKGNSDDDYDVFAAPAVVSIKGEMSNPIVGENYRLFGEWVDNGKYGRAFSFGHHEVVTDGSSRGTVKYLMNYVTSLGVKKSTALVEHFGTETLTVLRTEPERASEVAGITTANVEAITKHFAATLLFDPAAYARLSDLFAGHRFPKKLPTDLLRKFKSEAPEKVLANPYLLLAYPRCGWITVDRFAIDKCKYHPKGLERHTAGIAEALARLANDGHTYGTKTDIDYVAIELLDGQPTLPAWQAAVGRGLIVNREYEDLLDMLREDGVNVIENPIDPKTIEITDGSIFALPKLAAAERNVANRLTALALSARKLPKINRDKLNAGQCGGLDVIEANGLAILTGPPGTGKTFTVSRIIKSVSGRGCGPIHVACPTGKAAKRSAELLMAAGIDTSRVPCTTIHRLLEPVKIDSSEGPDKADAKKNRGSSGFAFTRTASNPIDARILIIDECSMVDVELMSSLLSAVRNGTTILFVGDHNQLPSVGPGAVLRDMMTAGIATVILNEIVRSDGCGTVVKACHDVKDGKVPKPIEGKVELPLKNWIHFECTETSDIQAKVLELHKPTATFPDVLWDRQVISPQKEKPAGICCNHLNRALADLLNPDPNPPKNTENQDKFEPNFRIGDKVVRTKNGICSLMEVAEPGETGTLWKWRGSEWALNDTDIVNGDMGTVLDIVREKSDNDAYVVVQFRIPERTCRLPFSDCNLIPAYAMTVHKCQGSGFRMVILPVHNGFYFNADANAGIWCRELFYTAISRTEELLVTIGPRSAIEAAVGRKTIHTRRTQLVSLLGQRFQDADGDGEDQEWLDSYSASDALALQEAAQDDEGEDESDSAFMGIDPPGSLTLADVEFEQEGEDESDSTEIPVISEAEAAEAVAVTMAVFNPEEL